MTPSDRAYHSPWQRQLLVIVILSGSLLLGPAPAVGPGAAQAATFFCIGDCNLNGTVTIDEILIGVNIALGTRSTHDCPPFDGDDSGTVTVDELVSAVRSALDGCDTSGP